LQKTDECFNPILSGICVT